MGHIIKLIEIHNDHIPIVNSWYHHIESYYVEQLTKQYIEYVTSDPNYYCWVVYLDDIPIGCVSYEISGRTAYISLILCPEYRGKGYGRRIFKEVVINRSEIQAVEHIVAGINRTNEASIRFFESMGFKANDNVVDEDGFINYYFDMNNATT